MLHEILTQRRKQIGMSIDDLVEASGLAKGTVSKIMSGITPNPQIESLKAIVYALGMTLEDLDDKKVNRLSPEALELARKYDQITDPYDKRMIDSVVDISFERCASREELPPIPTTEWLNSRIVGPDPRKARDEDLTDRTHTG